MIHCRLSILLLIILAMTIGKGFAQEQEWSVHTCIEKLSVKKDPKGKIFKSVLEEISNLDTMTRCDVLQILHRQKTSSGQRYKIRASFIINFLAHNLLYCPFQIDWLEESKSMELLA